MLIMYHSQQNLQISSFAVVGEIHQNAKQMWIMKRRFE